MEYQQSLQTVSDPLLGWTTMDGLQYYVRQFRNMKGRIPLDAIDAAALTDYAGVVGQLLAKGHARTSGASMIAGYMGSSDRVDKALCTVRAALRRSDRSRPRRTGRRRRPRTAARRARSLGYSFSGQRCSLAVRPTPRCAESEFSGS